jgi:hypothetical protein
MLKNIYYRYPYIFNLVVVLVLIETTRALDWLAWYPPSADKVEIILRQHLFEFLSLFPFVLLLITSYKWALKGRRKRRYATLVLLFTVAGPAVVIGMTTGLENLFTHDATRARVTVEILQKYSPGLMASILFLNTTFYLTRIQLQYAKQTAEMHKAANLARYA